MFLRAKKRGGGTGTFTLDATRKGEGVIRPRYQTRDRLRRRAASRTLGYTTNTSCSPQAGNGQAPRTANPTLTRILDFEIVWPWQETPLLVQHARKACRFQVVGSEKL